MKFYKLTDKKGCTKNETIWGEGVTNIATGTGKKLCSSDVIHVYTHPLLAVIFNPIHAVIQHPLLWECETTAPVAQDGLKVGVKSCTTIKTIPLPKITRQQKIKFAILCAKQVCKNKKWNTWADTWLSGKDRSKAAAVAADAAHAAHAAAYATVAAAAANAAHAAAVAAYATAVAAAHAAHKIDFISLALLAVKD